MGDELVQSLVYSGSHYYGYEGNMALVVKFCEPGFLGTRIVVVLRPLGRIQKNE